MKLAMTMGTAMFLYLYLSGQNTGSDGEEEDGRSG